jgi:hypothetical protein
LILQFSGHPQYVDTSRNFKRSCIMLYAKPWKHPNVVSTLSIIILLSAWINSSTDCTVVAIAVSTGRPGQASSATFERPWENLSTQLWAALHDTLFTFKRKHFFMNILYIESFCPQKTHNRMLFLDSTLLKHSCRFDYWNQPLNVHMHICYLDSHEAGLCCYRVIHIEDLLLPLQLFDFHLWPIYWLSLVKYLANVSKIFILQNY